MTKKKTERLMVRFSSEERETIKKEAEKKGLTEAQYVRMHTIVALHEEPVCASTKSIEETVADISDSMQSVFKLTQKSARIAALNELWQELLSCDVDTFVKVCAGGLAERVKKDVASTKGQRSHVVWLGRRILLATAEKLKASQGENNDQNT